MAANKPIGKKAKYSVKMRGSKQITATYEPYLEQNDLRRNGGVKTKML
jgi:hypothetical protein